MLLAELDIRHTRRHLPTRRVALASFRLPMSPVPYGAVLVGAVVADNVGEFDDDQRSDLERLLHEARRGAIATPHGALRHRIQDDLHGLARSRHRLLGEDSLLVVELAVHGTNPVAQVIGSVLAVSRLAPHPRMVAMRAVDRAIARPGVFADGLVVRHLTQIEGADVSDAWASGPEYDDEAAWSEVAGSSRWAMETLGFNAGSSPVASEVQRRFRRLITLAHPDHGGTHEGAGDRIQELAEARRVLLEQLESTGDERAAG